MPNPKTSTTQFSSSARAVDNIASLIKLLTSAGSNLEQQKLITAEEGLTVISGLEAIHRANVQFTNDLDAAIKSGDKAALRPSLNALKPAINNLNNVVLGIKSDKAKQALSFPWLSLAAALVAIEEKTTTAKEELLDLVRRAEHDLVDRQHGLWILAEDVEMVIADARDGKGVSRGRDILSTVMAESAPGHSIIEKIRRTEDLVEQTLGEPDDVSTMLTLLMNFDRDNKEIPKRPGPIFPLFNFDFHEIKTYSEGLTTFEDKLIYLAYARKECGHKTERDLDCIGLAPHWRSILRAIMEGDPEYLEKYGFVDIRDGDPDELRKFGLAEAVKIANDSLRFLAKIDREIEYVERCLKAGRNRVQDDRASESLEEWPHSLPRQVGAASGKTLPSEVIREMTPSEVIGEMIERGRKLDKSGADIDMYLVAREMPAGSGISYRDSKDATRKKIERTIKRYNESWTWKKNILPLIRSDAPFKL